MTSLGIYVFVGILLCVGAVYFFESRKLDRHNRNDIERKISKLLENFSKTIFFNYSFKGIYKQREIKVVYNQKENDYYTIPISSTMMMIRPVEFKCKLGDLYKGVLLTRSEEVLKDYFLQGNWIFHIEEYSEHFDYQLMFDKLIEICEKVEHRDFKTSKGSV